MELIVAVLISIATILASWLVVSLSINNVLPFRFGKPKLKYDPRIDVWVAIRKEVEDNYKHWGEQNWAIDAWLSIIMEEVGEAAKEVNDEHIARSRGNEIKRTAHLKNCRNELKQVAAVVIEAMESLDRNELKEYRQ